MAALPFGRRTPEWGSAASIVDGMALVYIRALRVPASVSDSPFWEASLIAQGTALKEAVLTLVPEGEAEAMRNHLLDGSSAFLYHTREQLKNL